MTAFVGARRLHAGVVAAVAAILILPIPASAQTCLQQKPLPKGCVEDSGGSLGCTPAVQLNSPGEVSTPRLNTGRLRIGRRARTIDS